MSTAVDIETVPRKDAMAAPYPESDRQPPGNYKSDEAIAKWRDADRVRWQDERAKECSLNPRLCRVLAIGTVDVSSAIMTETRGAFVNYAPTEDDEADTLREFWNIISAQRGGGPRFVTWNGGWDLRVLVLRSMALNVPIPDDVERDLSASLRKYRTMPHYDVKAVLLNWPTGYPTGEGLAEWAAFFGIPGKTPGLSGKDVYPLYLAEQDNAIKQYVGDDVMATARLFHRISRTFPPSY